MLTIPIEVDDGFDLPQGNPFQIFLNMEHYSRTVKSCGVVQFQCPFKIDLPYGYCLRVESAIDGLNILGHQLRSDGRLYFTFVLIDGYDDFVDGVLIARVFVERVGERTPVRFAQKRNGSRMIRGTSINARRLDLSDLPDSKIENMPKMPKSPGVIGEEL